MFKVIDCLCKAQRFSYWTDMSWKFGKDEKLNWFLENEPKHGKMLYVYGPLKMADLNRFLRHGLVEQRDEDA